MFGLISPLDLVAVGLYLYVGVKAYRDERSLGMSPRVALREAAIWPHSSWQATREYFRF